MIDGLDRAFLVCCLVIVMSGVAAYAGDKGIQCPVPMLQYPASRYVHGESLLVDALNGAYSLHRSSPQVTATAQFRSSGGKEGGAELVINANFSLEHQRPYPGIFFRKRLILKLKPQLRPTFQDVGQGVGLWVQTEPTVHVIFLFKDASGRTFSAPAHHQTEIGRASCRERV